jgi:uncharacterized protein (DUF1786 family)
MTNEVQDPFDFSDTSDLAPEIAAKLEKRVSTSTDDNAKKYGELVASAGRSVNISQIIAAATRVFGEVPTAFTVRSYLNRAVQLGILEKSSKTGYQAASGEAPAETSEDVIEDVVSDDLEDLADL